MSYFILLCCLLSGGILVQGGDIQNDGRHLSKHKCRYGSCGGPGNYDGYQGGYQGYQGGYQGYQGGYQGGNPYPPINIGISQSQASSSGGYGGDYYSPYNQYNQYNGYPNNGPHSYGYNGNGPNGFRPYNNGYNRPFGGYNNQFNGNYYLGNTGNGYGLVPAFDDDSENYDEDTSAKKAE